VWLKRKQYRRQGTQRTDPAGVLLGRLLSAGGRTCVPLTPDDILWRPVMTAVSGTRCWRLDVVDARRRDGVLVSQRTDCRSEFVQFLVLPRRRHSHNTSTLDQFYATQGPDSPPMKHISSVNTKRSATCCMHLQGGSKSGPKPQTFVLCQVLTDS